ncbi:hypothetical protein [Humibacter ginsenosidimutans]|uniref:Uncharacterized protein n=1 Tax=Humibacter ginsenosidimutans TaxID=2599293 RepID=A0A5B8M786_9MICO|nr:hypothetical protein [Humibacter ginsenosidimutans]QDZ15864.1 hypothetical protein FPZ11_14760 [Humibacter ginsenosidimutans]
MVQIAALCVAMLLVFTTGPGAVPWFLVLILLPATGILVGYAILERFAYQIRGDLRAAGIDVKDGCFIRSPSDVSKWLAREGIERSTLIRVGDGKYGG